MPTAAIYMFIALGLYTYAVWNARKEGLKVRHLLVFGLGLIMDSKGTYEMSLLAGAANGTNPLHYWTGLGGLIGMALHFLLAVAAAITGKVTGKTEAIDKLFHKVSVFIYIVWVIAFLSGTVMGILGLQ